MPDLDARSTVGFVLMLAVCVKFGGRLLISAAIRAKVSSGTIAQIFRRP